MYEKIIEAANRIAGAIHHTPILTSTHLDQMTNNNIFLKCENFQRIGAAKFRGAYNAISLLSEEQRKKGIIAYSSGNHAQAVSLVGKIFNIPTTVVMPKDVPEIKLKAAKGYNAKVVMYDRFTDDRQKIARDLAEENGYTLIPPYNDHNVVYGQGTVAKEFLDEVKDLDYLLTPCGGGSLLSGCAIYLKEAFPKCKVIGVEPELADDAARSFRSGSIQGVDNSATIADGLRTPCLGDITFDYIRDYVDDMLTVTEEEILESMYYLWSRQKIVVEPSGAVALAPVLFGKLQRQYKDASGQDMKNKRIGIIISGGNVDVRQAGEFFKNIKPESL